MSSIQLDLCNLLNDAAGIIRRQSVLLAMHGIETGDGKLESDEYDVLSRIRDMIGEDESEEKTDEDADHISPPVHRFGLFQKRHKAKAERRAGPFHRGK